LTCLTAAATGFLQAAAGNLPEKWMLKYNSQMGAMFIFVSLNQQYMEKTIHQGRNVKRFREMLGIKQDALAFELNLSQQTVSLLEQKEVIDDKLLDKIAHLLKVPAEAIKNFDEEKAISYINTFNDNSISHVIGNHGTYNFNPIEKWIEVLEENKKLYERLLEGEKEKNALLQKFLNEKR
jgi:transcriptional regulator with XRE-family HTH domain